MHVRELSQLGLAQRKHSYHYLPRTDMANQSERAWICLHQEINAASYSSCGMRCIICLPTPPCTATNASKLDFWPSPNLNQGFTSLKTRTAGVKILGFTTVTPELETDLICHPFFFFSHCVAGTAPVGFGLWANATRIPTHWFRDQSMDKTRKGIAFVWQI